MHYRINLLLYG